MVKSEIAKLNADALNVTMEKAIHVLQLGSLPPSAMQKIAAAGRLQIFLDVLTEIKNGKQSIERASITID